MIAFAVANWVCCLVTGALLVATIHRWRFLLVKPSIFFLACFHLFIQWPTAIFAADVYRFLADPWSFALTVQAFAIVGLPVSLAFGGRSARVIWKRLEHPKPVRRFSRRRAIGILAVCVVAIVVYYLSTVPPRATGLYAVLFDPRASAVARDSSLNRLGDPVLQYGYSFLTSVLAPLLAVLLAAALGRSIRRLHLVASALGLIAIALLLVACSLTGARSLAASLLLTIVVAWLVRKRFPFNPAYVAVLAVIVLSVPVVLTIFREGLALTPATFGRYLRAVVLDRVFYAPLETGLWFAQYTERHGLFGVAAIPKLAELLGFAAVNAPNLVGRAYTPWRYDFISANTSFLFAYYAYFGLLSLPFSLLALWGLDLALIAYRRISDNLLLACVASASVLTLALVSIEYSTFWLSGGFGVLLLTALAVDRACRRRLRLGAFWLGTLRTRGAGVV